MMKEDYIMRLIAKIIQAIAAMIGFRKNNQPDESIKLAENVFEEMLDTDLQSLAQMPVEEYSAYICEQNYTPTYLDVLARLTNETANAFALKRDEVNARSFYEKSLVLYRMLTEKDKTYSFERENIIAGLEEELRE